MAQITKIRYADGRVVRPGDWTSTPLYSAVDINSGALQNLLAFSYGEGGDVPGSIAASGTGQRVATKLDTNMKGQGSVLAENESLLIYGLSIELYQRSAASTVDFFAGTEALMPDPPVVAGTNVLRVQRDTLVSLNIASTKEYLKVPLGFLPAARGVRHVLGSSRSQGSGYSEGVFIGQNGGVSEHDHRLLATPQEVGAGEAFNLQFAFPFGSIAGLEFGDDSTARITARVYQRGIRRRPVA